MTARRRIEVAEAAALIEAKLPTYPAEKVPLDQALGRILLQPVCAERDQPPFDRVTMDGIAVRSAGLAAGHRRFLISGSQAAGAAELGLGSDDRCIEIMTGAAMPADADTVIPVERIHREGDVAVLEDGYEPEPGQFLHRRGSDHRQNAILLEPGTMIGPAEVAVLTISGQTEIDVASWPSIAVISTGDELVDIGQPLEPFQIRSSNDRAIEAMFATKGCPRVTRARLPDDPGELRRQISTLHSENDLLILSGGVSMGRYDYVPQILEELGVVLVFHKILQKPGLPMWFGMSADGKPVFALPGNPVSTLVCVARYVLPALHAAMGGLASPPPIIALGEDVRFEPDLTLFMPVVLRHAADGQVHAMPRPTNTSGDFVALAGTDGIVELERGRTTFPAGHTAPFYRW